MDSTDEKSDINLDPSESGLNTIVMIKMADCNQIGKQIEINLPKLQNIFTEQIDKIHKGDIKQIESALHAQAAILQEFFQKIIIMASSTPDLRSCRILSEIALKTQNQCRNTLATLAAIKHPKRTMFIKQQNNAINQQLNNDRSQKISQNTGVKNELLTEQPHETLDIRRTSTAIGVNTDLETVDTLNGG